MQEQLVAILALLISLGLLALVTGGAIRLIRNRRRSTQQKGQAAEKAINDIIDSLAPEDHAKFMVQYESRKKHPGVAAIFAVLLGGLGVHKFYLGHVKTGIVYILFVWTYVPALLGIVEAFSIGEKVKIKNAEIAGEIARELGVHIDEVASS